MTAKVADMGVTLERAASYVMDLGTHIASLPAGMVHAYVGQKLLKSNTSLNFQ